MGRLVSCVDEKGSSLHDVVSESILLQRAFQISTASLSCSLIRESLHHTNSVSFLKINRVYQKKRGQIWRLKDLVLIYVIGCLYYLSYLIFLNLSFLIYEVKSMIPTCFAVTK